MLLKKPSFWKDINLISILFYPISLITYSINFFKNLSNKKKFNIKSICVGNIYVGGTGKTPLAIKIGKILKKKFKLVYIKKNYDYQLDEQRLLKKSGRLISIKDRSLGLKKAIINKFNLAIFDDGLQDKKINYDVTIVCFNSTTKIGNGFLLPAGPLRENLSSLRNYDAIFLNGEKNEKNLRKKIKKINNKIKIFEGKYEILNLKKINRKKKYLIFSGIGNPEEFENTLKKNKIIISEHVIYPDHYKFTFLDIENIKKKAKEKNLNILTTEKDYMRLNKTDKLNINFVKIELRIKNFNNFYKFLLKKL